MMVDLFAKLKKNREDKGLSLSEASAVLRISENYLNAIENKDYSKLPEIVYSIGFIRNYAAYLDIDPRDLIAQFKKEICSKTTGRDSSNCERKNVMKNLCQFFNFRFNWEYISASEIVYFIFAMLFVMVIVDFLLRSVE
ncbi:MAG: helix-turn-helix domain-containing protein [Holosporaceae bacterium]|jgi:cytoskeletal protein RodZ|nr:helix-turn-helix domain-containing protein [Holosporaceae bacterium]